MYLDFGGVEIYIDIYWFRCRKINCHRKKRGEIAVEVKSFISVSAISEFHKALGQFINYRTDMSQKEPDCIMYLAVPNTIYETFFKLELIQIIIKIQNIKLIIYDPNREEISQWIN